MSWETSSYPESRYGGFTDIDGTIAFYNRVNALLDPDDTVIDFGCGRGEMAEDPVVYRRELRNLRGKCNLVIGIDIDSRGRDNACIDEFRLADGRRWPIADRSANMIVADFVLEHLDDPPAFFAEAKRVLADCGYLCIRTSNRWSYVAIASRLIPKRFHSRLVAATQSRDENDVFPTLYRCNTRSSIMRELLRAGFSSPVVYHYEAEPRYCNFSSLAYKLAVYHQKLALASLKSSLFAFASVSPSTSIDNTSLLGVKQCYRS